MKKIIAGLLCLVVVLLCGLALAETAVDTTAIATQVLIWVLCGVLTALGALATWAVKTYIVPWLRDVAVPWLKQHNLLDAANVAVEYAEAVVDRYNCDEKWKLALTVLESKGWDIDSVEGQAAGTGLGAGGCGGEGSGYGKWRREHRGGGRRNGGGCSGFTS